MRFYVHPSAFGVYGLHSFCAVFVEFAGTDAACGVFSSLMGANVYCAIETSVVYGGIFAGAVGAHLSGLYLLSEATA